MQPAEPAASRINWALLFVAIGGVLGLAFVLTTPSMGGTDEPQHVTRVALIDQGWFIPPTTDVATKLPDGYVLDGCFDAELVEQVFARLGDEPVHWSDQFHNARCGPTSAGRVGIAVPANVYSPVPYLPALVGFRAGRAVDGAVGSIYGARLVQLAAFLALVWFAIRSTPWGKPLLFTLGLLPVTLQGAAAVSADPITNGLALCVVALVLALIDRSRTGTATTRDLVTLGVVVSALVLSKSAYVPLALLVLAVPTAAFGSLRRRITSVAAIVGAAVVLAGAWNLGVVSQVHIVGVHRSDSVASARWIRHHPLGFLKSVLRGWSHRTESNAVLHGFFIPIRRFHHNPALPLLGLFAWLGVARLVDPVPGLRRRRIAAAPVGPRVDPSHGGAPEAEVGAADEFPSGGPMVAPHDRVWGVVLAAAVAAIVILLVEYGLAIAANPVGAHRIVWVQGRYFLPLLPLTLFGFSGVRTRVLPERLLLVLPVLSAGFASWWLWYVGHIGYGWL